MRAVSTTLDVVVFLLLVSAAVGTLATVRQPVDAETSADESVEVLASSTLSFEYELRGDERRAHGTIATLLARGALENATLDDRHLSTMGRDYRETLRRATRERLVAPNRTQVRARWEPYRGAPLQGEMVVGPAPPTGVDVHTATITVPVPVSNASTAQGGADYERLGRSVANATADGLLPATRVDAVVYRESPAAIATTRRYQLVAAQTGVSVSDSLEQGNVTAAHERATAGLAETFATDMRERFDRPETAAATVETGSVRIIVRRWNE